MHYQSKFPEKNLAHQVVSSFEVMVWSVTPTTPWNLRIISCSFQSLENMLFLCDLSPTKNYQPAFFQHLFKNRFGTQFYYIVGILAGSLHDCHLPDMKFF